MFLKFLPRIASILVLFFGFLNLSAQTIDTSELNEWVKQARKSQHNYDFKQSTYWFRKAVKAYKEIGGVCQTFSMENQIAYNYLDQEQGPEAIHLIDSLVKSFTTQSDCQDTLTKISLLMTQHIIYRDLNRADASKRPLDEARELAIQMNDSVWLAKIYNNYTAYYGQRGANYLALEYASRSMELKRRVMDRDDPSFRRGLFTMANYAERIGQYETAYLYLDSIISLYHGQEMGDLADTYHLLSLICCRKKDYEIARKYAELALDEFIKQSGPSSRSASFGYQEVGMALTGLEKYREALPNFEKAYAIRREIFGKDDRLTLSSLSQLVKTQIQLGDTLNSIDRFKEVVQAFTRKYDISEAPKYALNLLDLGTLYAEAGLLDSALIYFYRVQQIAESYYPVRDRIHSQTHLQLARYGPLQTRDHHIHQALFSLLGDSSLYALNRRTLAFASDKYAVLQAFYIHAQNLYELFQNTKNFQYLKDLLTLEPQFSMIKNEIFNQFLASKSVIESAPIIREIGLLRLRSAWVLYQQNHEEAYLDLALRAMEESKNILLQTQLFEKNLKNLLHLPDSLVQRERELYFEINNLDYVLKENPSDSLREHK
ncbi:MAG: tetratricopeptide repeat protein, partial [Saprospiraceae bacterium]|nr:tetratricopeptide repeat protein [Saprospiraceae bacterium]